MTLLHKSKAKVDGKKTRLKVYHDEHTENPRKDYDHLGTLIYCGKYDLGSNNDTHTSKNEIEDEELIKEMCFDSKKDIWLPVFILDHSEVTLSSTPFSCQWDSGQIGFIFVTLETVRSEWNVKRVSKKLRETVKNSLESEIKELDNYLTGQVYYFTLEEKIKGEWVDIDSYGGIIGDFKEFWESEHKDLNVLVENM